MWLPSDLVYTKNRSGPNTEPWGTPVSRKQGLDKEPFHVTWKVRFVKYDVYYKLEKYPFKIYVCAIYLWLIAIVFSNWLTALITTYYDFLNFMNVTKLLQFYQVWTPKILG